jgi:hypothetical protein
VRQNCVVNLQRTSCNGYASNTDPDDRIHHQPGQLPTEKPRFAAQRNAETLLDSQTHPHRRADRLSKPPRPARLDINANLTEMLHLCGQLSERVYGYRANRSAPKIRLTKLSDLPMILVEYWDTIVSL